MTPLMAAMMALVVVAMLGLASAGRVLALRTEAHTAADAAALAGAVEGREAAARLAEANGAELIDFTRRGTTVVVEVRVGDVEARASARARQAPGGPLPQGGGTAAGGAASSGAGIVAGGDRAGLAPAMLAALARADRLIGRPVFVVSGLRSRAEQQVLWERRHTNPLPVARPGTSDHESGLAVDVSRHVIDDLVAVAGRAGLCRPLPASDPVHFILCGA